MLRFVALHRFDDRASARVPRREAVQVALQVRLDLPLGLLEEAEVPRVARLAGREADRERPRIPQRVEQARAAAELGRSAARVQARWSSSSRAAALSARLSPSDWTEASAWP